MNITVLIGIFGSLLLWASTVIGIVYGLYQWGPKKQRFGMAVWKGFMVWIGSVILGAILFLIGMLGHQ